MFANFYKKDFELLLTKSKHSIEIATILFIKGTLTHDELASALNIKKNNLSNIIRKIEPFDILFIRRIGRNVYYSLNVKGNKFCDFIKKEKITK